ncbi:putative fungal-specific transcription factor [Podospora appendiculata]|uniref:Fungal-specific transcription factor n=1 Tax=Podospora appendiculata TaxID=314037 RepID=A0AAE0X7I1_9PEZI|nr:putative fungal-specific transcription factor [Podospora appendiculata]
MPTTGISKSTQLRLAPAPSKTIPEEPNNNAPSPPPIQPSHPASEMPFNCQSCVRKKVKCNRRTPSCSSCTKSGLECCYRAPPPPRPRKRKQTDTDSPATERTEEDHHHPHDTNNAPSPAGKTGKLLSADGRSRYIDSRLWLDAGEASLREMSEHEQDEILHHDDMLEGAIASPAPLNPSNLTTPQYLPQDPLSAALLGSSQTSLLHSHPTHDEAMKLWAAHVENVEPLCKVLHIPTTAHMLQTVSQHPASASRAQECLLFSIYHFAVLSMTDDDCMHHLHQPRPTLLARYQHAVRQSLVNASWLRTTDMSVMQALVLFLIAMRSRTDPHTFWILTGVAVRIGQRMGLHRDGTTLNLSPFETQMRRRLFWQLFPLDGYAGQFSGTGIAIPPDSWDTQIPLNVNDDQLHPSMTQPPHEHTDAATDMIFCLSRAELSNFYTRTGVKSHPIGPTIELKDSAELDRLIDGVEASIEAKHLRYCDITNPLHFLTLAVVRSAANAVRLRNRMPPLLAQTIADADRRTLCALAQRILDSDCAIYRDPGLRRFHWQIKAFFLWDAVMCVVSSLARPGFFAPPELTSVWGKMEQVHANHPEIAEGRRALQAAVGKATLRAWIANPPPGSGSKPEPGFITLLRSGPRRAEPAVAMMAQGGGDVSTGNDAAAFGSSLDGLWGTSLDLGLDSDFDPSTADWMFWDQVSGSEPYGSTLGE